MKIDGHRRSDNFEDRGDGGGPGGLGGGLLGLLPLIFRRFGIAGVVVVGLGFLALRVCGSGVQGLMGGSGGGSGGGDGKACEQSQEMAAACDFSRVILASTEDVWTEHFAAGRLPSYGASVPTTYAAPTLVVFTSAVETGGCGRATSASGPFYCPADKKLYIDPGFYEVMDKQLKAPGDFAQAYVIAHEVGHHVQNLIGSMKVGQRGETKEQTSVRVELQADCLAGVWGHGARSSLSISDADLAEATGAAHAIGDDALGHRDAAKFTHGSSVQRIRWFRRGFETGDPRQCDTFAIRDHAAL